MLSTLSATELATAVLAGGVGAGVGALVAPVVTLFRVHSGDAPPPPPSCPHCQAVLPWSAWFPLPGRLLARRRCVGCDGRISGGTVVPVLLALVLAALSLRFGAGPQLPAFGFLGVVGVVLAVIDARTQRLPNPLVLPAYPIATALLGLAALGTAGGAERLVTALAGMTILAGCYWLLWFIYPAGMGWGDVKLSGLLGLYLGWTGLWSVLAGTLAAFTLSAVFGLTLILLGRATRKSQIPFGPFMLLGTLLVLLLGPQIRPLVPT